MKRLAIASVAVGVLLAGFFAVLVFRNVPTTPKPIDSGAVHLSRGGLTLWSSVDEAAPACTVKTAAGADVLLAVPGDGQIAKDGMEYWYEFARSAKSVPAGDYVVSCVSSAPGVKYAVSPRSSFVVFVASLLGVVFSLLAFFALGTYLLTIGRRRRKASTPPPNTPPPGSLSMDAPDPGDPQPDYPPITFHPAAKPGRPQDG
jgi:hypothetical protein